METHDPEQDLLAASAEAVVDSLFSGDGRGLALLDADLRFVRVNKALAQINGRAVEEHLGRGLSDLLPTMSEDVLEACRAVIHTGRPVEGLVIEGSERPGDVPRTFECSYHPVLEAGEVAGLWVAVEEITAERAARHALGRVTAELAGERAILREVLARTPAAMVVMDGPELRFRYLNDQAVELLSSEGDLLGRSVFDVFPEGAEAAAEIRDAVLERGETVESRDVPLASDDEEAFEGNRYYTFLAAPLGAASGRPTGILNVSIETTAEVGRRRALEQELESEHRIATELQVSLMPDRLPPVPGLDVASGFRPAGEGHEIGGDFYDVFQLAERCWMVVIGDVCGKGAEAAAVTALARYTLRAAAIEKGAEPRLVMEQLNEAILRQRDDMRFLSAVCVFVDLDEDDGVSLRVCVAGHQAPLLVGDDGSAVQVGGGEGALLGVWDDPHLGEETVKLSADQRLVLYTDGVLDAQSSAELTEADLASLLASRSGATAAETVTIVERAAVAEGAAPGRDDIAVLVLRPHA
jgi:serine phosphatase RsbU (regulator of sigma subunit)